MRNISDMIEELKATDMGQKYAIKMLNRFYRLKYSWFY